MAAANPIRNKQLIYEIAGYLKKQNERDYILFMLGIYSGLRISDILKLKVSDVRECDYFIVTEQKTGNIRKIIINPELQQEIEKYIKGMEDEDCLIRSREKYNRPISRQRVNQILEEVGDKYKVRLSAHSLRKTFGYHFYVQYGERHALPVLMKIYGHSREMHTLLYIGVEQEYMDKILKKFRF